jgi:excisionase family DNA binding protein
MEDVESVEYSNDRNLKGQVSTPLLNTREAARFLRVSEASIRRWTDAGLLATQRVGRRRARRFTEDDLRQFMGGGGQDARASTHQEAESAVSLRGVDLAAPCHLSTYFSSDEGRFRLAIPFLAAGLRAGSPCFLMASGDKLRAYAKALEAEGVDMDVAAESGRLVIKSAPGRTAGEAMEFFEAAWGRALQNGPAVIRLVGDMAAVLEAFDSVDDMMTFEESYDLVARRYPVAAICQYDVRSFDGVALLRSLKAHPDVFGLGLGNFLI